MKHIKINIYNTFEKKKKKKKENKRRESPFSNKTIATTQI
jgi:hypothetical protein